jgi:hypothetical protein
MNPQFGSLVMGLAAQAQATMDGQRPPGMEKMSDKEVRQVAQSMIDTLGMLEAKTRGNLEADEQRLLTEALTALRFRFVKTGGPAA